MNYDAFKPGDVAILTRDHYYDGERVNSQALGKGDIVEIIGPDGGNRLLSQPHVIARRRGTRVGGNWIQEDCLGHWIDEDQAANSIQGG